jgi:hypothetical protein
MDTLLNPGAGGFIEALASQIYVDKTGILAHTCVASSRNTSASAALAGSGKPWQQKRFAPTIQENATQGRFLRASR